MLQSATRVIVYDPTSLPYLSLILFLNSSQVSLGRIVKSSLLLMKSSFNVYGTKKQTISYFLAGMGKCIVTIGSKVIEILGHLEHWTVDLNCPWKRSVIIDSFR